MKSAFLLLRGALFANVNATNYVDSIEPLLSSNRDPDLSGPRTPETQQAALRHFDQYRLWLKSSQACASRLLGSAGAACITDRSRSGKWPWEQYYRDPIVSGHF